MASQEMKQAVEAFVARMGEIPAAVDERRARGDMARLAPPPPGVVIEPVEIGGVPGEWVWAEGVDDRRVVLLLHYGGYVAGNAAGMRPFAATLSRRVGARCLGIDYRLAPDDPFPAAWEDAVTAYRGLLEQGRDPSTVAVVGASAGGGLAVGAVVAARDAGLPLPAAIVAVSPWADMTLTAPSMVAPDQDDPLAPPGEFERLVSLVLGDVDPSHPWASPVHADLTGLPPLLVEVGTAERLLDDARNLVATARRHGVEATVHVTEGAIHCFPLHTPSCPEADGALARIVAHLDTRMA